MADGKRWGYGLAVCVILGSFGAELKGEQVADRPTGRYLPAVRTFADNVLRLGRDKYGPRPTPLFVDGLNVDTHEPVVWVLPEKSAESWEMPREWVLSNLASQQNLFRTLVVVSRLTGDSRYRQAAVEATRYAFDHLRHECGILYWGGHAAWDLRTHQPVGEGRPNGQAGKHEFKRHYPFYELMWEVDAQATRKFIEAVWSNHVLDWSNLDFNRHGSYEPIIENLWGQNYVGGTIPFVGKGLTFIHSGSDLYYAAAMLSVLGGQPEPMVWAKRLARRYREACHPETGLGGDNFSEEQTRRMVGQFGAEFGERFTEATVMSIYGQRYSNVAVCQLKLAERLGPAGEEFKLFALADLAAYARHAYDPSDGKFRRMLIDGTELTVADLKREGYVMERWLTRLDPSPVHFWAYALAYKLTGDRQMWAMTREIARLQGLGHLGAEPGVPGELDLKTNAADPELVFALLDLAQGTRNRAYLELARRVGDNLLASQFHHGLFVPSKDHLYCQLDTITPLALLYLEVALQGIEVDLPVYSGSRGMFHCPYEGAGRTYDRHVFYGQLRTPPGPQER